MLHSYTMFLSVPPSAVILTEITRCSHNKYLIPMTVKLLTLAQLSLAFLVVQRLPGMYHRRLLEHFELSDI